MRIKSLSSNPDRAGRYRAVLEDDSVMRLYRQTVQDFGLYAGRVLSDEELKRLSAAAEEMSAKMRAVRIVAASSVSKKDLVRRLVQKGENPQQAKAAVNWLTDLSLIDDHKTAEQIVSRCISKGYGLARAKQALYEKQIPREIWDEVLQNYPQQTEAIKEYLESKLTAESDAKEVKRAIDSLIRRGHHYGTIRRCLQELSFDSDEFPED